MSYEIITQCPNCSTSFKVKEVQLNAAAGAVRCGACLVLFQAIEHMLQDLIDEELVMLNEKKRIDLNKISIIETEPIIMQIEQTHEDQKRVQKYVDNCKSFTANIQNILKNPVKHDPAILKQRDIKQLADLN